jgi:hypothetical protein
MSTPVRNIAELRQLPMPRAVGYFPDTWGWLALLALLAIVALGSAWWLARRWRRASYRRCALRQLAEIEHAAASDRAALAALPPLLKRVAMSAAGGTPAAALSGEPWHAWLRGTGGDDFPPDTGRLLTLLAYAGPPQWEDLREAEVAQLLLASRRWTESHHVAA